MRTWISYVRAALLLAVGAVLTVQSIGCNTVEGAGRDVERGGEKLQDAAQDAKD
jgi:predicted small secreted protein